MCGRLHHGRDTTVLFFSLSSQIPKGHNLHSDAHGVTDSTPLSIWSVHGFFPVILQLAAEPGPKNAQSPGLNSHLSLWALINLVRFCQGLFGQCNGCTSHMISLDVVLGKMRNSTSTQTRVALSMTLLKQPALNAKLMDISNKRCSC